MSNAKPIDEFKQFQFRQIPPTLHHAWKVVAMHDDVTMEDFGLDAIREKIEITLERKKQEGA